MTRRAYLLLQFGVSKILLIVLRQIEIKIFLKINENWSYNYLYIWKLAKKLEFDDLEL